MKKQIESILEEVNNIQKKEGVKIQEIRAGNMQISQNELLFVLVLLKGHEFCPRIPNFGGNCLSLFRVRKLFESSDQVTSHSLSNKIKSTLYAHL